MPLQFHDNKTDNIRIAPVVSINAKESKSAQASYCQHPIFKIRVRFTAGTFWMAWDSLEAVSVSETRYRQPVTLEM